MAQRLSDSHVVERTLPARYVTVLKFHVSRAEQCLRIYPSGLVRLPALSECYCLINVHGCVFRKVDAASQESGDDGIRVADRAYLDFVDLGRSENEIRVG